MTRSNRLLVASVAAVLAILAAAVLAYALFLRGDNVAPLALGSPSPSAGATVAPGDDNATLEFSLVLSKG